MKRTLSLILALAMVMSLFTTVSFAVVGDSTVTATNANILKGGTTKLTATFTEPTASADKIKYYTTYAWSVTGTEGGLTGTSTTKDITLTGVTAGSYTVTFTATVTGEVKAGVVDDNSYYAGVASSNSGSSTKTTTITVDANTSSELELKLFKSGDLFTAETKSLVPAATYTPGITAEIWTMGDGAAKKDDVTVKYKSSKTTVATVNEDTGEVTAVAAGSANITAEVDYKGHTFTKKVATVTVASLDVTNMTGASMTNGTTKKAFAATTIYTAVAAQIEAATSGATEITKDKVTALTLKAPATATGGISYLAADGTTAYPTTATPLASDGKIYVSTTAGTIGSSNLEYSATVTGSTGADGTYSGKITFKSVYAADVTDKQEAPFFYEWFYLDAISGIKWLDPDSSADFFDSSDAEDEYYSDSSFKVDPSGRTSDWTDTYTGYDKNKVAKQVTVTFNPVDYDILAYVEDGKSAFNFDAFELFAENVAAAQDVYYDISVDHVEFPTVSGSKWTLKKGSTKIKSTDEFTASSIGNVYLDVTLAGYYDIPFRVYFDSKDTKTDSWTKNASEYYQGMIRVYAGDDGDIKYEVSYGDTVNFKSADFAALYKKMAGSKKVLDTVKIDVLPVYGALYWNNKVSSSYAVDVGDTFYYDPSSANSSYDLDKVTYWASKSSTAEYSVYIPVTMNGTGGEEVAVVEITINAGIPFKDIAKGSTFYDYIEYCYNKGIMGGKSSTNFDAKSSITRAQLVTTLYRMAGSPTTYNSKTLPFTDTTKLSSEFSNAVKWAYYNKIVGGTTATTFAPNTAVTRQALVKILYGYATAYDLDQGVVIGSNLGYYTDGGTVSASMKEAMNWALDYGLLSGNGALLNPRGSTTRGAAAKILANFHASFVG